MFVAMSIILANEARQHVACWKNDPFGNDTHFMDPDGHALRPRILLYKKLLTAKAIRSVFVLREKVREGISSFGDFGVGAHSLASSEVKQANVSHFTCDILSRVASLSWNRQDISPSASRRRG